MSITRWNPTLLFLLSIVIPAGIPMGLAAAHPGPQDDPLADAARQAQAEKKSQPASKKVWTTDDIPRTPGDISIVGTLATPPATDKAASGTATPAGASDKGAKPAGSGRSRATIQSELDAAKLDLNTATTDLDILTRKRTLDSQSYYGKPDYASDTEGAAQLKDEQDEIDTKKQQVDDAQKKVNDLQEELNALSGDQGATSDSSGTTTTSASSPGPQDAPSDVSSGNNSNPLTINSTLPTGRK
jgi:hypothetical protein